MKRIKAGIGALFACIGYFGQAMATDFAYYDKGAGQHTEFTLLTRQNGFGKNKTSLLDSEAGGVANFDEYMAYLGSRKPDNFQESVGKTQKSKEKGPNSVVNKGVFGSKAISFSNISTRESWQRLRVAIEGTSFEKCGAMSCSKASQHFSRLIKRSKEKTFFEKMQAVNTTVNAYIEYQSDHHVYKSDDYWATPVETAKIGMGDCEDFAVLKMALLKELGIPAKSMSLVILKDVSRNLYHAVLAVSTNKGAFILDNVHQNVVKDSQLPQYMPLYSFSDNRSWIHGQPLHRADKISSLSNFNRIQPGEGVTQTVLALNGATSAELLDLRPSSDF